MAGNLKALIGRLDDACRDALEAAAAICLARTNYEVDVEHYLLKLTEESDSDIARALRQFNVDTSRLSSDITRALDKLKTGNARTPSLSPRLVRLIEEAWMLASIDYGAARITSAHLLLALLADKDLRATRTRSLGRVQARLGRGSTQATARALVGRVGRRRDASALRSERRRRRDGRRRWRRGVRALPLHRRPYGRGARRQARPRVRARPRDPADHRHPRAAPQEQPDHRRRRRRRQDRARRGPRARDRRGRRPRAA